MGEVISFEDRRLAEQETVLEFPRIDGNTELDEILNHAKRWGKCLFRVAGEEETRVYPIEGEVVYEI
jgi:hypothetical protein